MDIARKPKNYLPRCQRLCDVNRVNLVFAIIAIAVDLGMQKRISQDQETRHYNG